MAGGWRIITETQSELSELDGWRIHMESKGFETRYKRTKNGVALVARPDFVTAERKRDSDWRRLKYHRRVNSKSTK